MAVLAKLSSNCLAPVGGLRGGVGGGLGDGLGRIFGGDGRAPSAQG